MTLNDFVIANGENIGPNTYSAPGRVKDFDPVTARGTITLLENNRPTSLTVEFHLAALWAPRMKRRPMTDDSVKVVFDLERDDGEVLEVQLLPEFRAKAS